VPEPARNALAEIAEPLCEPRRQHRSSDGASCSLSSRASTWWPYEPDPSAAGVLRRIISENGLEARVEVVEAFAAPSDGISRPIPGAGIAAVTLSAPVEYWTTYAG
jgi:hypothetical protein